VVSDEVKIEVFAEFVKAAVANDEAKVEELAEDVRS
jgi:hypothetical protein